MSGHSGPLPGHDWKEDGLTHIIFIIKICIQNKWVKFFLFTDGLIEIKTKDSPRKALELIKELSKIDAS